MRRLLIGLVLFGAVVSALGFMLSHESSGQTFITAPVERGTISTVVKATGSVDAVIHRMEQQLRKYKEKVQERHRSGDPRRQEALQPETEAE